MIGSNSHLRQKIQTGTLAEKYILINQMTRQDFYTVSYEDWKMPDILNQDSLHYNAT